MKPAHALQIDTAPPPDMTGYTGEQEAMTIVTGPEERDWTKPAAYLPNNNLTTLSAAMNATITGGGITNGCLYFTHSDIDHIMPAGTGRTRMFQRAGIFNQNRMMLLLDEADRTTTTTTFSIVCNGVRADHHVHAPLHWYGGGPTQEIADRLQGYEKYQTPNWDQFEAEPIAADTLAYARRLLRIMPTSLGTPDIAPAADGTIALEWVPEDTSHKLNKLFLDIGPGLEWRASWKMRDGMFDRLVGHGFTADTKATLKNLFDKLSG